MLSIIHMIDSAMFTTWPSLTKKFDSIKDRPTSHLLELLNAERRVFNLKTKHTLWSIRSGQIYSSQLFNAMTVTAHIQHSHGA